MVIILKQKKVLPCYCQIFVSKKIIFGFSMKFIFSKEVAWYALIYFFKIKYRSRKFHVVYIR